MLTLRRATADDADELGAMISSLAHLFYAAPTGAGAEKFRISITPQALAVLIAQPQMIYLVADDGNNVRGAVAIRECRHLLHLFVAPGFQGRGIGHRLWTAAREAALAAGADGMFTVNASLNAVAVYQRFGFEMVGAPQQANGLIFQPLKLIGATAPANSEAP